MIPNVKLTTAGAALLAKTPEGYPVPATRWQIGKGALPSGSSLDRTALVDPVEYLDLYDVQNQGTESLILGQFTNQGMESGFPFEEVGLLAQDPDVGEILMCYGNAFGAGEEIQPEAVQLREFIFGTQLKFSGEANMSGTIGQGLVFIPLSQRGQQNGVASLDSSGKVPEMQLPDSARLSNLEETSTLADSDALLMQDSAAESATKRVLWSTVKTLLAQVFVPLTRKINNKVLTADVTLTGADIAVSGSDGTKLDAALDAKITRINSKSDMNTLPLGSVVEMDFAANEAQSAYHTPLSEIGRGTEMTWYIVETLSLSSTRTMQVAHLPFSHQRETYARYKHDSTFSPWYKMYTGNSVIPVANGGTGQTSLDGLVSQLMGQGMCKLATGAYTGNADLGLNADTTANQTIFLPFAPKAVLVIPPNGEIVYDSGHQYYYGGLAVTGHDGYLVYNTVNFPIVQISGAGFTVYQTNVYIKNWHIRIRANEAGTIYNYIAIG